MAKLRREAETAKHALSSLLKVTIEIESFNDGDDFVETLMHSRFEELNADLFRKTMVPVATVIKDSGLSKRALDDIVLCGGSTRIPTSETRRLYQRRPRGTPRSFAKHSARCEMIW
jgi:heat shock protein 5